MSYSGSKGALIWDKYWTSYETDGAKKATHYLSFKNSFLLLKENGIFKLKEGAPLKILDVGCGGGEICSLFSEITSWRTFAGDISSQALNKAKTEAHSRNKVPLVQFDVYSLPFQDNTFDVLISYGYGSAASYKGAQAEVGRVLRPGGIAIIDFRNISLYEFLRPLKLIRYYKRYKQGEFKMYHFGKRGVAEEFRKAGLDLKRTKDFNTFPPVSKRIPAKVYIFFEKTMGRILKPLLARVFLAEFVKRR